MLARTCIATVPLLVLVASAVGQVSLQPLQPYRLPSAAQQMIDELAAQSDILILGEIHGTQEVPAIAAALLPSLAELKYGVLAVEVPADQQQLSTDWATGRTKTVPSFFAKPGEDGRGNVEALRLIRMALSPPLRWQLICFDESMEDIFKPNGKAKLSQAEKPPEQPASTSGSQEVVAAGMAADATMAANLSKQLQQLAGQRHPKVLVICGSLHARTANRPKPDKPWAAFWPSFAAVLQGQDDISASRIGSINVRPHSGGFFNGGKVNALKGVSIDDAEARLTPEGDWNMQLDLPCATPANFLSTPHNQNAAEYLESLAAAHAETGDFDSAIKYENHAIELDSADSEFLKGARQRLALYKDHKPYRDE